MKSIKTLKKALALSLLLSFGLQPFSAIAGNKNTSMFQKGWSIAKQLGSKAATYGNQAVGYAVKTWNDDKHHGKWKVVGGTVVALLGGGYGIKRLLSSSRREAAPTEESAEERAQKDGIIVTVAKKAWGNKGKVILGLGGATAVAIAYLYPVRSLLAAGTVATVAKNIVGGSSDTIQKGIISCGVKDAYDYTKDKASQAASWLTKSQAEQEGATGQAATQEETVAAEATLAAEESSVGESFTQEELAAKTKQEAEEKAEAMRRSQHVKPEAKKPMTKKDLVPGNRICKRHHHEKRANKRTKKDLVFVPRCCCR